MLNPMSAGETNSQPVQASRRFRLNLRRPPRSDLLFSVMNLCPSSFDLSRNKTSCHVVITIPFKNFFAGAAQPQAGRPSESLLFQSDVKDIFIPAVNRIHILKGRAPSIPYVVREMHSTGIPVLIFSSFASWELAAPARMLCTALLHSQPYCSLSSAYKDLLRSCVSMPAKR